MREGTESLLLELCMNIKNWILCGASLVITSGIIAACYFSPSFNSFLLSKMGSESVTSAVSDLSDIDVDALNSDINAGAGGSNSFDSSLYVVEALEDSINYFKLEYSAKISEDFVPNANVSVSSVSEDECLKLSPISEFSGSLETHNQINNSSFCIPSHVSIIKSNTDMDWTVLDDGNIKETLFDAKVVKVLIDGTYYYLLSGIISVCDFNEECAFSVTFDKLKTPEKEVSIIFGDKKYKSIIPNFSY